MIRALAWVAATTIGLAVGFLQWLAVGGPRRVGGRLLLAMAMGIGVSHALADGASRDLTLLVVALAAAVTAAYALLFDERRPGALTASIVGWAGGWILAEQVTGWLGMPWPTEHAVVGVIVGLAWGGLTAATGWPTRIRATSVGGAGR